MSRAFIDDGFAEHPKILRLSHGAFRLHVVGIVYCNRNLTDGHVSQAGFRIVSASAGVKARRYLDELVNGDLWKPDRLGDGYWIHDFLEHNDSAAEVREKRALRAQAGRIGGLASGRSRRHKVEANAQANSSRSVEPPPLPIRALALSPPSPSYEGGHESNDSGGGQPLEKLHRAVGGSPAAIAKLRRTWATPTEAACIAALEACTGPGVNDRLAVAISELKKRRPSRATNG